MSTFDIIIHSELSEAEASWLFLQANGPSYVFQTHEWCAVWQDTLGSAGKARPCVVEVRDERGPAMLLPLCVQPVGRHERLSFMDGGVADYNAPLVRPDALAALTEDMGALWKAVRAKLPPHDVILMRKMPHVLADGSPNPLPALHPAPHAKGSFQATLAGGWEGFQASRTSARGRSGIRRKRRRLDDMGEIRLVMPTDGAKAEELTRAILDLKGSWHKANGRADHFAEPGRREFYLRIAREQAPSGLAHVSGLYIGKTLITGHWGAVHGGRFYYLLPAYAPGDWMKRSPGKLLREELIRWSFAQGLTVFDFTLGDEGYKRDWMDTEIRLYRLVQLRSAPGLASWAVESLRGALAARPVLERLARRVLRRGGS